MFTDISNLVFNFAFKPKNPILHVVLLKAKRNNPQMQVTKSLKNQTQIKGKSQSHKYNMQSPKGRSTTTKQSPNTIFIQAHSPREQVLGPMEKN